MREAGDAITKYDRMKLDQKKSGALERQMIMTVSNGSVKQVGVSSGIEVTEIWNLNLLV